MPVQKLERNNAKEEEPKTAIKDVAVIKPAKVPLKSEPEPVEEILQVEEDVTLEPVTEPDELKNADEKPKAVSMPVEQQSVFRMSEFYTRGRDTRTQKYTTVRNFDKFEEALDKFVEKIYGAFKIIVTDSDQMGLLFGLLHAAVKEYPRTSIAITDIDSYVAERVINTREGERTLHDLTIRFYGRCETEPL
jgi:hypothetical protein